MMRMNKKIISFLLTLVLTLTTVLSGVGARVAKAEETDTLTFAYRHGTSTLIQVNTNLPTTTTCANFLAADNGCEIDQSSNQYQQFGWVGMESRDGTIVLTFNFNSAFTAGQTYVLSQGSVFGFTDGSKYTLDKNYTFTYNGGESWSMTTEKNKTVTHVPELTEGYTAETLVQFMYFFDFGVPADNTSLTFTGEVYLDDVLQENVNFIGYKNNTTICLNNISHKGKTLTIKAGSSLSYGDNEVVIDTTFRKTWDGTGWTEVAETPTGEITFAYRRGTNQLIQVNTDLPSETPLKDFLTTDNGCSIDESANQYQNVGSISMYNVEGTIVLGFKFNKAFLAGQSYTLPKGAVFGFTDGNRYVLDKDYYFFYDGSSWMMPTGEEGSETVTVDGQTRTVKGLKTLTAEYTVESLVQFTNFFDFGVPADNTALGFSGSIYLNGVKVDAPQFIGYANNTTICLNNISHKNMTLTIMAGSVIYYGDQAVIVKETFHKVWNGTWTAGRMDGKNPIIYGDANGNMLINSNDLVYLKKTEAGTYSMTDYSDMVEDDTIDKWDLKRMRYILVGVAQWDDALLSADYLLRESNFTGGEDFVAFADCPAEPTDAEKISEYKALGFNTALIPVNDTLTGKEYVTMEVGAAEYTLAEGEKELEFTVLTSGGNDLIQLKTNLPTGTDVKDFTAEDTTHTILRDGKRPSYFHIQDDAENTKAVYFNMIFLHDDGDNPYDHRLTEGDYVTLKAGTKLKVGDTYYVLTKTYRFDYTGYYRDAFKTLKSLGLDAWLRNDSNKDYYITQDFANEIVDFKDDVKGVYLTDEPFWTTEMLNTSNTQNKTNEDLMVFDDISTYTKADSIYDKNFKNAYLHTNQSGIHAFNHYCELPISSFNMSAYQSFFEDYCTENSNVASKKLTLGFDNYPFGYATYKVGQSGWIWKTDYLYKDPNGFVDTGISPYYLINLLIPAQVAKTNGNPTSLAIQTYLKGTDDTDKRGIEQKEEITFQLYAAMACGIDVFEYFNYNTVYADGDWEYGIIDADGNQTSLYALTKNANTEALPYADVINTFDWQGARFITGATSKNSDALEYVNNYKTTNLLLNDTTDGVLSSASSTNDVLIGYYTKTDYEGYMLANYNDPKQVTNNNSVTLTFADCTHARVYSSADGTFSSEIVELTNGSYTFTLKPGDGCFVIPVKAQN